MSDWFALVSENVARNPVARAVANSRMQSALSTFAVQLYGLEDGSVQASNLMAAAKVLAVGMHAADDASPEWDAMSEAQDRIVERSADGFRWRAADAAEIDIGMSVAIEVLRKRSPKAVRAAWLHVQGQEA